MIALRQLFGFTLVATAGLRPGTTLPVRYVLYESAEVRLFMNVFRVHFTWKEKEYILKAHSLDMTHPYFVAIKDLILPEKNSLLINPADDDIRKIFGEVRQLMLPFQSVSLIEEYTRDPDKKEGEKKPARKEVVKTDLFVRKS